MLRHCLALLSLCLLLSVPASGAGTTAARTPPGAEFGRGLLWRIDVPGQPPSYLFGTMHVDDERVLALPAATRQAFAGARGFAIEMIEDEAAIARYRRAMLTPAADLAAHLGDADFRRVAELLAGRGLPGEVIPRFKPWAALLVLLQPPGPSGIILDRLLLDDAGRQGKIVTALETVDEQIEVFDAMPQATQLALLRHVIDQQDELAEAQRTVTEAYLRADLAAMWQLNAAVMGDDPALAGHNAVFLERILFERNRRFAERLQPLLRQGGVFAAFGALHLHGRQGVPALLRQQGFRVRAVR